MRIIASLFVNGDLVSVFKRCAMGDDKIDSKELVAALNQTLGAGQSLTSIPAVQL